MPLPVIGSPKKIKKPKKKLMLISRTSKNANESDYMLGKSDYGPICSTLG
jgi:hypothetical protein